MALILCPRCRHLLGQDDPRRQPCKNCGGVYIHREGMKELVAELRHEKSQLRMLAAPYREAPHAAKAVDVKAPKHEVRYMRCPHCARQMNHARLSDEFELVLDYCLRHGVWFDPQELSAAKAWMQIENAQSGVRIDSMSEKTRAGRTKTALVLERLFPFVKESEPADE